MDALRRPGCAGVSQLPSDSLHVASVICCAMCPMCPQKPGVSLTLCPGLQAGTRAGEACHHVPCPLPASCPLSSFHCPHGPQGLQRQGQRAGLVEAEEGCISFLAGGSGQNLTSGFGLHGADFHNRVAWPQPRGMASTVVWCG